MEKKQMLWPALLALLAICWPAGLLVLRRGLKTDKQLVMHPVKSLSILGWVLFVFGAIWWLGAQPGDSLLYYLVCGYIAIGGILCIRKAKVMRARSELYQSILELLSCGEDVSMGALEGALHVEREDLLLLLSQMEALQILPGGCVEVQNGIVRRV